MEEVNDRPTERVLTLPREEIPRIRTMATTVHAKARQPTSSHLIPPATSMPDVNFSTSLLANTNEV